MKSPETQSAGMGSPITRNLPSIFSNTNCWSTMPQKATYPLQHAVFKCVWSSTGIKRGCLAPMGKRLSQSWYPASVPHRSWS